MGIIELDVKRFNKLPLHTQERIKKENPGKVIKDTDWIEIIVEN